MKRFLVGNIILLALLTATTIGLTANAALFDQKKPPVEESLVPTNAQLLEHVKNQSLECAYPDQPCLLGREEWIVLPNMGELGQGLSEEDWAPRMSVVNRAVMLKKGAVEHKSAYKEVEKYLTKAPIKNKITGLYPYKDNAQELARAFDDCLDYGCTTAYTITNINYPNTDVSKSQITIDGQDVCGSPSVRVWAKKGDNIIQLSASLNESYYTDMYEKCGITGAGGGLDKEFTEYQDCCVKYVSKNTTLIKEAEEKAQQLIKTFALEK